MAYNSISIKHYIKRHLELQREITLIELAPSPYFFVYTDGRTDTWTDNVKTVYPLQTKFAGGIIS